MRSVWKFGADLHSGFLTLIPEWSESNGSDLVMVPVAIAFCVPMAIPVATTFCAPTLTSMSKQ